jgi:hypothetical protein
MDPGVLPSLSTKNDRGSQSGTDLTTSTYPLFQGAQRSSCTRATLAALRYSAVKTSALYHGQCY